MSLDLEPPHRHRSGGLPIWLEWITAISALVVSVCSIAIALHNGQIENRMLKANSFPYLYGGVSTATPEGNDQVSVDFVNNGVGPADERSLKIRVGDRYVTSMDGLLRAVFPPQDVEPAKAVLKNLHNRVPTRFIAAKSDQFVFRIPKTAENARYWDVLQKSASADWRLEFCYCSVFDECWQVTSADRLQGRTPVKACKRDEPREFIP